MWHIGDVSLSRGTASFEIEKMKTNLERWVNTEKENSVWVNWGL